MTKRFTAKASTWTERLGVVQQSQAKLRAQLAELDAEERSLKSFLFNFYDEGKTEVALSNKTLEVSVSCTERLIMNQDKVRTFYAKMGVKVPVSKVDVVSFRVKTQN
jgi:hypothetical protein